MLLSRCPLMPCSVDKSRHNARVPLVKIQQLMFSGSFTQMDLAAVLRLLAASSQTGRLSIQDAGFHAEMSLYAGQIVHAQTDEFSGLDALYEICQRTAGSFQFDPTVQPAKTSLSEYASGELLENIEATIQASREFAAARPDPADAPVFLRANANATVSAAPEDLQLLLLADGLRTVRMISQETGRDLEALRDIFARFIVAGLVSVSSSESASAGSHEPAVAPPENSVSRPARFWRGKRID